MEPRETQVGVLFVHGIGQQTPGDTLIAFGEPLMGWVRRWLEQWRSPGESFQILKSALSEPVLESGEPAHLLFQYALTEAQGEPPRQSRWLLAESCWATEFRNPPFGRLAAWMIGVGAWMILSHFGKLVRLRLAGWKRWVLGLPLLLAAVLLALVVQLLVAILGLAALIPVPRLRRALSGLLLTLTGTLGDSYVLVSSPVQEAAAVSRLRRDLGWLSQRAAKVVVVAHSQGAAIAHQALQDRRPENVCRLITFGSGIGKLEELRLLAQPAKRNFYLGIQFGLPLATLSILLLPRAISMLQGSYLLLGMNLYFFLLALAPVIVLARILAKTWSGWPDYLEHVREKLPISGLEWHDFYSTADPVPNGPLVDAAESLPGWEGHQVVNLRSAAADHSAYWANQDEFVSLIVGEIAAVAGTGLIGPYDEAGALAKAFRARRRRVRTLLAMRAAAAVGAILALFGLRHQLRPLADQLVWKPLSRWADAGLLGSIAGTLTGALAALARLVTGASAEALRSWGLVALGALMLSAAVGLCYLVAKRAWRWWDRYAIDDFFTLRDRSEFSTMGVAAVAVLLGATPLIFGGAALVTGDLAASAAVLAGAFQWYFKALAIVALLFGAAVFSYVLLYVIAEAKERKLRTIVVGTAILIGVPALALSVAALVTRDLQRSLAIVKSIGLWLAPLGLFVVGILLAGYIWFFVAGNWGEWTRR